MTPRWNEPATKESQMTGSAHRPLVNAPPNHPSPKRLEHELASARRWRCKVSLRLRRATPAPHHACMHAWAPVRRATRPRPRDHVRRGADPRCLIRTIDHTCFRASFVDVDERFHLIFVFRCDDDTTTGGPCGYAPSPHPHPSTPHEAAAATPHATQDTRDTGAARALAQRTHTPRDHTHTRATH